jgi:hypothetical protein
MAAGVHAPAPSAAHPWHRPRRVPLRVDTLGVGGKLLLNGRGRLAGWSLLDTQGSGSVPATTNVLDGSQIASGAIITIPANTAWYGTAQIEGEIDVAPGGLKASGFAIIQTATGLTPSNVALARLDLVAPAAAAASDGTVDSGSTTWGPGWIINSTAGALSVNANISGLSNAFVSMQGVTLPFPGGVSETVVELWDGSGVNGELLAVVAFPQGTSVVEALGDDGPDFVRGVFLNVVSGSVRGSVWVLSGTG